jgi:phospholipid N-methyltransferase
MTSHITKENKVIIELGAGDGAITQFILDKMSNDAKLLSFEINDVHFKSLKAIQDKRFIPILDSAENLNKYLKEYNLPKADTIISAIPFVVLPTELTLRILDICQEELNVEGFFVQFHYSMVMKNLYHKIFKKVDMEFVLLNAPPAIVFKCQK